MVPISSLNCTRFVLLIKFARATTTTVEIFDSEGDARERWRAAAIAAVTGMQFGWHAVSWARLFSGPPVGNKHDTRRLAAGGHFKMLENS